MEDWFEARYGYQLTVNTNVTDPNNPSKIIPEYNVDNDQDGINAINESKYYMWGANPFMRDIFIEVDWMDTKFEIDWERTISHYVATGNFIPVYQYTIYKMSETAQNLVTKPFGKHDIALHIDDGCMGGGTSVTYEDETEWYEEVVDNYWDNNSIFDQLSKDKETVVQISKALNDERLASKKLEGSLKDEILKIQEAFNAKVLNLKEKNESSLKVISLKSNALEQQTNESKDLSAKLSSTEKIRDSLNKALTEMREKIKTNKVTTK